MSNPYLGEIRAFGGTRAPTDWHFCDGSLLQIAEHGSLYALLGTSFGGDGETTFALPDMRGRTPIGQGEGPGMTLRTVGERIGSESVTLTEQTMTAHSHTVLVADTPATSPQPGGKVPAAPMNNGLLYLPPNAGTQVDAPLAADSLSPAGGGQPHENRMPVMGISFIIALAGLYPSRN